MLLLRVAGISLKYELEVVAIESGSLTIISDATESKWGVFCDRCFCQTIEFIFGQTFLMFAKDDSSRL